MTGTVIDVTPHFQYATLTPIEGEPTFLAITQLKRELVANAVAVPSPHGNGQLGHAVVVLGQAEYDNLAGAGNQWIPPNQPPPAPVIPVGANGPAIANANSQWERAVREWETLNAVESSLKRLLLEAVDDSYISSQRHPLLGYSNVTVFNLITHLENTYAEVNGDALERNLETLNLPQ